MKKYHLIITILLSSVFFLTIPVQSALTIDSNIEQSLGVGLGLPYGLFGVNYEVGVNDWLAPTAGVGITPAGMGWNLGARVYYPGRDEGFRWRATLLYGTNCILETDIYEQLDEFESRSRCEYESEEGISMGIGFSWRFKGNWTLNTDLFYVNVDTPKGYEEYGPDIKGALGISRRFGI